MNSVCQIAFIPVRKEPSHRSEMLTQLLFGDDFKILADENDWLYIKNYFDDYEGWVPANEVEVLENDFFTEYTHKNVWLQKNPITTFNYKNNTFYCGFGSRIAELPHNGFLCGKNTLSINPDQWILAGALQKHAIIEIGFQLLGTPYLWGGRSIWGIDCSGFTQNLYRLAGINLKRDAWQQEMQGIEIEFTERKTGDLAFFSNEDGKVIHVGIVLNQNEILHASGKVRIDNLHNEGIINSESGKLTHVLKSIKNIGS